MPPRTIPAWRYTDHGLVVHLGSRRDPVPELVVEWLTGPGGIGLSADVATDLLHVEQRIRQIIAQLCERVERADEDVRAVRAEGDSTGRRPGLRARVRRRQADRKLCAAISQRAEALDAVATARNLLEILRSYVIGLDVPNGLLRETAEGWRRRPDPPASVVVFEDEGPFLDADPRRATTSGWGGRSIAGVEQFGLGWRRDGDEDDPTSPDSELRLSGPWQIGYIQCSGEVYAIRRCGHLSREVWLLGTGFDTLRSAREALLPVMPRMRVPNSLILAAETVHATQVRPTPGTSPRSGIPDRRDHRADRASNSTASAGRRASR